MKFKEFAKEEIIFGGSLNSDDILHEGFYKQISVYNFQQINLHHILAT